MIDPTVFVNASEPHLTRFLRKLREDAEGCWLWIGAPYALGRAGRYGRTSIHGRGICTHVVAYEWANGPIYRWLDVDHVCRKTRCCNPSHLRAVTRLENNASAKATRGDQARLANPLYVYLRREQITWEQMSLRLGVSRDIVRSLLNCTYWPEGELLKQLSELLQMGSAEVEATFAANIKRRAHNATRCAKGHPMLDPTNVFVKQGRKKCRACARAASFRRYEKKKQCEAAQAVCV